ncbi:hypothetical protein E4T56_gene14099 [Termitomyces sp. T112]|nr:hypothetical protein E4T56_gene14099 [Termitomyces sp. T112]
MWSTLYLQPPTEGCFEGNLIQVEQFQVGLMPSQNRFNSYQIWVPIDTTGEMEQVGRHNPDRWKRQILTPEVSIRC